MNFLLLLSVLCSTSIDDYIISVGDTLLITVYGNVSLSYQQAVTSNGDIFIQYVPSLSPKETPFTAWEVLEVVNVAGMNVRTATEIVEERFKKYFKDIKVNLSVTSFRKMVYITGAVIMPSAQIFNPNFTGLDYIGLAGGPSERGDIKRAYILTKEGKKLPITGCPPIYSTVVVPEIGLKWWQDYVTVASAIVTLLVTWLTLTK